MAYSLNSKTVVRAGFNVNYSHGAAGIGGNGSGAGPSLLGFNASASFSSPGSGLPAFYWDQGWPVGSVKQPPVLDPTYGIGQGVSFVSSSANRWVTTTIGPIGLRACSTAWML